MALYRFGGILQNLQVLLVLVGKYRIFLNKPKTFNINIDICFTCSVMKIQELLIKCYGLVL